MYLNYGYLLTVTYWNNEDKYKIVFANSFLHKVN
jgi:hypothetical protein